MRKILFLILFFLSLILVMGQSFSNDASLYGSFNNIQEYPTISNFYNPSDFSDYWPILNDMKDGKCEAAMDFVVMIPPAGCTPSIVRSDILAEQNVPVFCKLVALQINPLIKLSSIRSITFKGDYPKEISGIRFYPARAGAGTFYKSLNNNPLEGPIASEIGYAVIILRKTPNESSMTKWVNGTATANLVYDAEQTFGFGKSEFFLEVVSDEEWESESAFSSFWNGRMFLRVLDVEKDKARIAIYLNNKERPYRILTLKEGETSDLIYFPGFYCMAGIKAKLNSVDSIEDSAILQVGDELINVRQNSRILNGRCSVREISINSNEIGYVRMGCGGKDFYLILSSAFKPNISVNKGSKIYEFGERVIQGEGKNDSWYLAYSIANSNSRISNEEKRAFIVLVSENKDRELETMKIKRIRDALRQADIVGYEYESKDKFIKEVERFSGLRNGSGFVLLFKEEQIRLNENIDVKLNDVVLSDGSSEGIAVSSLISNEDINEYLDKNKKALKELYELYPQVKSESGEKFSERAYLERISIMEKLVNGRVKTIQELNSLREEFLQKYPDSKSAQKIRNDIDNSGVYDRKNASVLIEVNGKIVPITLLRLKKSNPEDKKAEVYIDNAKYYVVENSQKNLSLNGRERKNDYFVVEKITKDYVHFKFFIEEFSNGQKTHKLIERRASLEREDEIPVGEGKYKIKVTDIEIKRSAHVSLIPEERNIRSEANFTFKIGIEKRLFELNPEKADKRLEKLNKTIKNWEEKLEKLGNVIEGWKKACFFTGLGLQAKNLIEGFSGKAIARKEVMRFYREECENKEEYKTGNREVAKARCYSEFSQNIENDVNAYTEAIKKSNEELKKYKTIEEWKESNKNLVITKIENNEIKARDLTNWNQVRAYLIKKNLPSSASNILTERINSSLQDSLAGVVKLKEEREQQEELKNKIIEDLNIKEDAIEKVVVHSTASLQRFSFSGIKGEYVKNLPDGVNLNDKRVEFVNTRKNGTLLVVLTPVSEGGRISEFKVDLDGVYNKTNGNWKKLDLNNDGGLKAELSSLRFIDGGECKNKYKDPRVRYFTSSYAKGLPAIVPFDDKNGWYVRVSQSQGDLFSSEAKGYTEAGVVRFFYICNVGPNGREENMGGDDICQSFDVNNYDKVGRFGGCSEMTSSEVLRLAKDAQEAIRQVASQYNDVKNGATEILIMTSRGEVKVRVGDDFFPDNPGAECYDFMSPRDCNILFNVCDPVICPPSRCDFGGRAPVDNVIASGVAGSLLLCLPNFGNPIKGGVIVPICLTGVHAGIDSYLSILRAQYSCIEQAKKTGKYVGVCDYFTAVYTCEFFWRNAQPFLKNIVPRVFEFVSDPSSFGRVRGGGEYLTFQKAWENMEQSMNYFKNQYAKKSFRFFQYSDVKEFGSGFCRAFIGTSFPTKGKALDQLFKPESPTQFYAEFSEIPFTEATVPPTSQYKVLYHIYAGNDQVVSFRIYLKDPPASSYYQGNPYLIVASGAIDRGKYFSESKDFTAPAGYKQLCVEINGKEECGFKQVTSDIGLDYLTKVQAQEESKRTGIETEKDCISGKASLTGLTSSFNIQERVQSAIKPELYRMGIVRICASENPGKGTSEETKWKIVGHCGNTNIKCWLSEESINTNTISLLGIAGTVKEAEEIIKNPNLLREAMTEEETRAILAQIRKNLSQFSIKKSQQIDDKEINPIKESINKVKIKGTFDFLQAEAHYLETLLYLRIVDLLASFNSVRIEAPALTHSEITAGPGNNEKDDYRNKKLVEFKKGDLISYKGDRYKVDNVLSEQIAIIKLDSKDKFIPGTLKNCPLSQTVGECLG